MFFRSGILRAGSSLYQKTIRTFLSEEFKCTTEWNSRLNAPFMQKIKMETFYYDIEQTFQQIGKASAIDIDIFVNKIEVSDEIHTDEISDLLYKLRLTEETSNALDSTGHAAIRNFIKIGNISELLNILDNRISYGVFMDTYMSSYLLDYLIKKRDYTSAAKVAVQLMLQEDLDNKLSRTLALYSCIKYLENPEILYPVPEKVDTEDTEIVKVRVKFLRNEFFDDHFDLKNQFHLVGKTLHSIGSKLKDNFGKNVQLLGLVLYEKYDKALEILKSNSEFYKDVIIMINKHFEKNINDQQNNENLENVKSLLEQLLASKKLKNENFLENLNSLVKNVVVEEEPIEIENQKKIYLEWNKIRETKLNEELKRLDRAKRFKEIEKLNEEMAKEEQKLWFFENEEKIDLQIDSKRVYYPKRWFGKKKIPRVIDEGYIPPEIVRQRKN